MRIAFYCQHVLGMGHLYRTLEICKALDKHTVRLFLGGPPADAPVPAHVEVRSLPELSMDPEFSRVASVNGGDPAAVLETRRALLMDAFQNGEYALFLVELYPFGRKAFRAELDPVLEMLAARGRTRVVCSLRDVLVEKKDQTRYEERVVKVLNRWFHAVLVHADPALARLDETFSRVADIRAPVVYTGYVTPMPAPDAREKTRAVYGLGSSDRLVVASAGGGSVGYELLRAVLLAFRASPAFSGARLHVYSGPYMAGEDYADLVSLAGPGARVARRTADFISELAAADLSVSMAGYNTAMNVAATGVPALVLPFGQNREQGMRAARLSAMGVLGVLEEGDLAPEVLAGRMERAMAGGRTTKPGLNLAGAEHTARWLSDWMGES
jgi:predicted glycosyltransferase